MAEILGVQVPDLSLNISDFIASTWWWVAIVVVLGIIITFTIFLLLFFRTYNKKVIVFENVGGVGYPIPVIKTRARTVKVTSGFQVLKPIANVGSKYLSSFGKKMGKNTYWFYRGADGYLYNFTLGDFDAKAGQVDIEFVDIDVRGFNEAMDRMIAAKYDKQTLANKILLYGLPILLVIVFLVGIYLIIGKIGTATQPLSEAMKNVEGVTETNARITERLSLIVDRLGGGQGTTLNPDVAATGLQPTNTTEG